MKKILICLDGEKLSKAVCDYGIYIAEKLKLPLVLLNVVEHSHQPAEINLSGSIGLGAQDNLLDELTQKEMEISKQSIAKGRAALREMEEYLKSKVVTNYSTLQRHGSLYETLEELSDDLRLAIIAIKGEMGSKIGSRTEELVRTLTIPILLVNREFLPIDSILMAYDGSAFSKKAITVATKNPIFPNTQRHLVNVNPNRDYSNRLLEEAKALFADGDIKVETSSLSGDTCQKLLDYQKANQLNLIAMGSYSHHRFRSAIFGSFTKKMINHAEVPLLLFR